MLPCLANSKNVAFQDPGGQQTHYMKQHYICKTHWLVLILIAFSLLNVKHNVPEEHIAAHNSIFFVSSEINHVLVAKITKF